MIKNVKIRTRMLLSYAMIIGICLVDGQARNAVRPGEYF